MKQDDVNRELSEASAPYLNQAAWLARLFARISVVFALAVTVTAVVAINAMAGSGFNAFEIMITAALVIAALILVGLSIWLALKARVLSAAIERHLGRKEGGR